MSKLREERIKHGYTLKQIGSMIGVSEASVSLYETGKREPSNDTLKFLADLYGVTVDYLLGRDDPVIVTGNPGSGKSSILSGDWYPSTPPQPPLMLDGGPTRGIIEDRPETEAIKKNIMKKLDELAGIYDQAYTDVDGYVDFLLHKNGKP